MYMYVWLLIFELREIAPSMGETHDVVHIIDTISLLGTYIQTPWFHLGGHPFDCTQHYFNLSAPIF